jgi:hypothetical protein
MKATPASGEDLTLNAISHAAVADPLNDVLPAAECREECALGPGRPDFSLVLGGPLFQLFRRLHLSGSALEQLHRRVLATTLFAWLPLLFLSVLERHALGGAIQIPLLRDIEANVRFLVALPVFIVAEVVVHQRISPLVRRFVDRRIVVTEDLPAFDAAINSAVRARDSVSMELTLLVSVYTIGLWLWRSQVALVEPTWYAIPEAKRFHLTMAGYWYVFVSIPVFQFILLRWYVRLVIWFRLLWQISRLNLHLSAAHPDRAGGIGFLGGSSYAFAPVLFSQGTLLAGLIGSRVLYEGRELLSFKMEAAGFVGFFVFVILGPLVMFTPLLERAQRKGSAEYGLLANRYVFAFEDKWAHAGDPGTSNLLGTADIRSLADMKNVYSSVRQMRTVPFGSDDIARLAATTAAPLLPLLLKIFSVPQLVKLLVKIVFR